MTPTEELRAAAKALRERTWDPGAEALADAMYEHVRDHHKRLDRGYNCWPEDGCGMVATARAVLADRPTALPEDIAGRYKAIAAISAPPAAKAIDELLGLLVETDSMRAVLAGQAAERGQLAEQVRALRAEVSGAEETAAERQQNALHWQERAEKAEATVTERGEALAKYQQMCGEFQRLHFEQQQRAFKAEQQRDALLAALDPGFIADALTAHLYPDGDGVPGEGESGQHREEAEAIVAAIRERARQEPGEVERLREAIQRARKVITVARLQNKHLVNRANQARDAGQKEKAARFTRIASEITCWANRFEQALDGTEVPR